MTKGSSDQTPIVSIRPLDSETSVRVGVIQLRKSDFPFKFGRKSSHGHEGARHYDRQELKLSDRKPLQLSREHCSLEIRDGQVALHDLNSTLGTIVNGQVLGRKSGTFVAMLSEGDYDLVLGNPHSKHRFELIISPSD